MAANKAIRFLRQRTITAKKAQKSRSVVRTLPAPTGGWNARDVLAKMPEDDAVELINFFPDTTDCTLRYGSELWANLEGSGNTANAMLLDGSGYATTPDTASISVAGDIDLRAHANLDDWTTTQRQYFISKGTPGTDASYDFFIENGYLGITLYPTAGGTAAFLSDTVTPATNSVALWVRATVDIDNGASLSVATFYTSSDGNAWTQLGATQSQASFASINDSAVALEVGRGTSPLLTCDSADFDGTNDYMTRGAGLTGAADSKTGILSCWLRVDGGGGNTRYVFSTFDGIAGGLDVELDTADCFRIIGHKTDLSTTLEMRSFTSYPAGAAWTHFLASWDLANTTGQMYTNDVLQSLTISSFLNNLIDNTTTDAAVGARPSGGFKYDGCIAELYFAPGQYLDFSIVANRRKFISADGKPVNLGATGSLPTGTAPIVYQHLDDGEAVANFATNRGTGGDFTITGTLDTGSTSPSD